MKRFMIAFLLLSISITFLEAQVRIKMKKEGGVYTTPCLVNGLRLRFIFDTGASNVSLSLSEAIFMLKNGYMDEGDLMGSSYSQIANGDIVENTTVNINELEIGGIKLYNVEAIIIHELSAPLLLGQSAIQELGKIQLDGDELVIIDVDSPISEDINSETQKLSDEAYNYYKRKLYSLSANTYQKAYDMNPSYFLCIDLHIMGNAYRFSNNYHPSIKYYELASNCLVDIQNLYWNHLYLSRDYREIGAIEEANLNAEKAILYAENDDEKSSCYTQLGFIAWDQGLNLKSNNYFDKGLMFYMIHRSMTFNDIRDNKIKDLVLAHYFSIMASNYVDLNETDTGYTYVAMAALCGDKSAISLCRDLQLDYKKFKWK